MNLEVTCWAVSKAHAEAMLSGLGIIEVQPDGSWSTLVRADIKPAVSVPYATGQMITDAFGNEVPEMAQRDGFHFDIIYRGETVLNLLRPLPLDADGNPVPWPESADLFDKTLILEMVEARTGVAPEWVQTNPPVPPGYEAGGVRVFDPALISSRSHGWA